MKEEIKAQWVAALRSGDYVQGRGVLRDNEDRFCCLGVLCDLAERDGAVRLLGGLDHMSYGVDAEDSDAFILPESVREWSGLSGHHGDLRDHHYETLVEANDQGEPFGIIADIIEDYL